MLFASMNASLTCIGTYDRLGLVLHFLRSRQAGLTFRCTVCVHSLADFCKDYSDVT